MKNLLNRADLNKRGYEWYVRQPQTLALSEPSLAVAELVASPNYPNISGRIFFQGLTNGTAILGFITDRFCLRDVIGRSVIIHENPDDYRTQPSGNSGRRIACGVIRKL